MSQKFRLSAALAIALTAPGLAGAAPQPFLDAAPSLSDAVAVSDGIEGFELARRGRGADDGPNHVRGGKGRGRGADDGPNHAANELFDDLEGVTTARRGRGADDGPNHVRGGKGRGRGADDTTPDDRGGKRRGRGADDGPNHT